ncbi:MAG: hypothetical protein VR69_01530 [Peptococcaceae bacterium BRH_c4b]|nr:MAG: hypothetical protein VR69_01530 [Peptococcaceae bacterium BRH_c4b]
MNINPLDRAVELIRQREQREQTKVRKTAAIKFNPLIAAAYKNTQHSTAPTPYNRFAEKVNFQSSPEYELYGESGNYDEFMSRLNSLGITTESIKPGLFLDILV